MLFSCSSVRYASADVLFQRCVDGIILDMLDVELSSDNRHTIGLGEVELVCFFFDILVVGTAGVSGMLDMEKDDDCMVTFFHHARIYHDSIGMKCIESFDMLAAYAAAFTSGIFSWLGPHDFGRFLAFFPMVN